MHLMRGLCAKAHQPKGEEARVVDSARLPPLPCVVGGAEDDKRRGEAAAQQPCAEGRRPHWRCSTMVALPPLAKLRPACIHTALTRNLAAGPPVRSPRPKNPGSKMLSSTTE